MARNTLIQVRRGDSVTWYSTNPVLSAGEWGFDTSTKRYKIGDGLTAWNSLSWSSILPSESDIVGSSGIAIDYYPTTTGTPVLNLRVSSIPSAQVSDFNSSVSGLLPSFSGISGVNVNFSSGSNSYNISLSSPEVNVENVIGFVDAVNDRVNDLLVAGSNVVLTYNDSNNDSSSLTIGLSGVSLVNHTHLLSDITDVTSSTTELNYLDGSVPGTGVAGKAIVLDSSSNITNINKITTTGDVTVGGNLVVNGATTTVNSTEVDIGDNIITVNTSGLSTGGFRVFDGTNYQSLIWNNATNRWGITGDVQASGTVIANAIEVSSTGLVNNLNSDKLDNQDGSYYLDWVNTTNKPTITGILSGDVVGTGSITLGVEGGTLSISTTIQPNSVTLGTDTTGQYASTISVTGSGLSATSANADDGTAYTISSNATSSNIANSLVVRDSSGSFAADTITASGFIGNGSGLNNLNASSITTGTLDSARLPTISAPTEGSVGPTGTFVSSVTVDSYGRITGFNRTTHTLATTSVKGIASFDTNDFSVSSGDVSIKVSGISNSQLVNDRITIGQTSLELGSTYTTISGVSANSPVILTYFSIDGGTP